MEGAYLPTIIVRHPRENPRKCSVLPLRGRADVLLWTYPVRESPPLDGYVRLSAEGPPLSPADAAKGLLLLGGGDGTRFLRCAGPLATWLAYRLSAGIQTWHRPRQRARFHRGALRSLSP